MMRHHIYFSQNDRYQRLRIPQSEEDLMKTDLDVLLQEAIAIDKANADLYAQRKQMRDQILLSAVQIWGKNSNEYKYIARASIPSPEMKTRDVENAIKDKQSLEKEQREKELEESRQKERIAIQNRAVQYLIGKGKVYGVDFTYENAWSLADGIAQEEIKKEITGKEISCECDECGAWVIGNNRCTCGNRRVSLIFEGNFENMHYYGECY